MLPGLRVDMPRILAWASQPRGKTWPAGCTYDGPWRETSPVTVSTYSPAQAAKIQDVGARKYRIRTYCLRRPVLPKMWLGMIERRDSRCENVPYGAVTLEIKSPINSDREWVPKET